MANCKVISLINWKGGVGKTTLTHHLGTGFFHLSEEDRRKYFADQGPQRILLIDNDAQCSLSVACLGEDEYETLVYKGEQPTIKDCYLPLLKDDEQTKDIRPCIVKWQVKRKKDATYPTIDLFPSHQDLIYTDMNIAVFQRASFGASLQSNSEIYKFQLLDRMINQVRDDYDFIFIDCPPNLNYTTQNAVYASDYYLIPTTLEALSAYGITSIISKVNQLNHWFKDINHEYRETKLLGITANMVREYKQEPKGSQASIQQRLQHTFGDELMQNHLTYGDGISENSQMGFPVYQSGSSGIGRKQSEAMLAILCEMLERIRGNEKHAG